MGRRPEGGGSAAVRRQRSRDETRRLREHPGPPEAPGRVDDAGRTYDLAGGALSRLTVSGDEMRILGVVETAVYVDNLQAAEDFYGTILGLRVIGREAGRHVFFRAG